jgi:uncharacterized protein (DUF1697 family)
VPASHVALLRGINVGKAKRISMADLKKLFESLGHTDVRTLLNSGNVVFTVAKPSKDLAAQIESTMTKKLGVSARVTVLSAKELAETLKANPLLDVADEHSRLLVSVFNTPADRKRVDAIAKQKWTPEAFALGKSAAYLWCVPGILDSKLAKEFGRAVGDSATSRNWATMMKLKSLADH